ARITHSAFRNDDSCSSGRVAAHGPAKLAHNQLQEEKRGFGGLLVLREVAEYPPLFFAAERRIGHDGVHPVFIADLAQREAKGIFGIDLGVLQAMQEQVHFAEQVRQGLRLDAEERATLELFEIAGGTRLLLYVLEGLDEEAARAGGGVENGLAEMRVNDAYDK